MHGINKKRVLLTLLLFCLICTSLWKPQEKQKDVYAAEVSLQDISDGVYTIEGRLRKADEDRASMGNASLTGSSTLEKATMKLRKSGTSVYLQLEFHPLTAIGFTGYLYSMSYFPDAVDKETIPKDKTGQPVTVTQYYSGVFDDYNKVSTGLDTAIRGRYYPHYAVMPVTWGLEQMWVQVYVPVMETLGIGQGTQYAKLLLDWSTLQKTDESVDTISITASTDSGTGNSTTTDSSTNQIQTGTTTDTSTTTDGTQSDSSTKSKLKIKSLKDGTYTIQGKMLKTDKKSKSMSDKAINHNVLLTVKNGSYKLTLTFKGMTVGTSKGYLSRLRYFKSTKTYSNGLPSAKTKAVTVDSYQKYTSGKKVSDAYGSNYPAKVTFPMIASAKKNGYVPLQVYVPIMEAISTGSGTQAVYLKLDLSSIVSGKKGQTTTKVKESTSSETTSTTTKNTTTTTTGTTSTTSGMTKTSTTTNGNSTTGSSQGATNESSTVKSSGTTTQSNGKIYSCKIVPGYKHPVDGTIEDSGGESSYATGQGMVESAVNTAGMLEAVSDGTYYLTLRMKLMDYTSGHEFKVQKKGDSSWQKSSAEVTSTGSDSNGKTSDMCIQVPAQDCVVRVTMYVEPMGRNVIFYCYPTDFTEGQPSDMKATKVTLTSTTDQTTGTQQTGTQSTGTQTAGTVSQTDQKNKTVTEEQPASEDTKQADEKTEDTVSEAEAISGEGLSGAQGLSLSVTGTVDEPERQAGKQTDIAKGTDATEEERSTGGLLAPEEMTMGMWIVVLTVSLTISGLIVLGAGAGLVYHFRRNWRRWGEDFADDEDDENEDEQNENDKE